RGFDPRQGGGGFHPGGPFGGQGARDFHFTWDNAGGGAQEGFSAEYIFADLLGGRARRGRQQPARGEDFTVATTISFDEAARGGTRRVGVRHGRQVEVE